MALRKNRDRTRRGPTTGTAARRARATEAPSNKFRYYAVTTTTVVRTLNQTDAVAISRGRRGVTGEVLAQTATTTRLSATQARTAADRG